MNGQAIPSVDLLFPDGTLENENARSHEVQHLKRLRSRMWQPIHDISQEQSRVVKSTETHV